jgi:hypothetical protein
VRRGDGVLGEELRGAGQGAGVVDEDDLDGGGSGLLEVVWGVEGGVEGCGALCVLGCCGWAPKGLGVWLHKQLQRPQSLVKGGPAPACGSLTAWECKAGRRHRGITIR